MHSFFTLIVLGGGYLHLKKPQKKSFLSGPATKSATSLSISLNFFDDAVAKKGLKKWQIHTQNLHYWIFFQN